jgi:SAM-dependent methyltransferase
MIQRRGSAWYGAGSLRSAKRFYRNPGDHVTRYAFAGLSVHVAALAPGSEVGSPRVLDFGCGDGYGSRYLLSCGASEVWGVDADSRALERAHAFPPDHRLHFISANDFRASASRERMRFDRIVCLEVLEHLHPAEIPGTLAFLRSLLNENGVLVLSTPNLDATRNYLMVGGHPLNPHHIREYTVGETRGLLKSAGFERLEWFIQVPSCIERHSKARKLIRKLITPIRSPTTASAYLRLPVPVRMATFALLAVVQDIVTGFALRPPSGWQITGLDDQLTKLGPTILVKASIN